MLKKLMIASAASAIAITTAMAQSAPTSPPAASPPPPAKTSPAKTEMAPPGASASAKFVNTQRSDQFLASSFKGTDVLGPDNEKIGDVSDILFDKDGKILAYVVGVGGFLGIGSKDVAMAPDSFQVVPGDKSKNESDKLKVAMTKDQLKQAANFEPYKAPASTTGSGAGAPRTTPSSGGMAR